MMTSLESFARVLGRRRTEKARLKAVLNLADQCWNERTQPEEIERYREWHASMGWPVPAKTGA